MSALPIAGTLGICPEIAEQAIHDDERVCVLQAPDARLGADYVDRFVR